MRDIATIRQGDIIKQSVNNKLSSAGIASPNFGKPFSYLNSVVPGGIVSQAAAGTNAALVESQRSNHSNDSVSSKTRQFMMGLNKQQTTASQHQNQHSGSTSRKPLFNMDLVTKPYSKHQAIKASSDQSM